jgi:hypothetical protein
VRELRNHQNHDTIKLLKCKGGSATLVLHSKMVLRVNNLDMRRANEGKSPNTRIKLRLFLGGCRNARREKNDKGVKPPTPGRDTILSESETDSYT